jgi:hypothetical protein
VEGRVNVGADPDAPIRVNRAAFRRASGMADFTRFEEPRVGEAWATAVVRIG